MQYAPTVFFYRFHADKKLV